jgi:hypothetical protein
MQHPACQEKVPSYFLVGLNTQNPTFNQSCVQLNAPYANQAMEPIWQHSDDSAAFEPPDSCVDPATIEWKQQHCIYSEIKNAVYLQQNHLDNNTSQQLSTNCLVNARTMLDAEDRKDIRMLDMDESWAYHKDEESIMVTANPTNVDDKENVIQFTDRLRGQHTAKEIM